MTAQVLNQDDTLRFMRGRETRKALAEIKEIFEQYDELFNSQGVKVNKEFALPVIENYANDARVFGYPEEYMKQLWSLRNDLRSSPDSDKVL